MKSSLHSPIPSLPFLLNHLRLPSPELDPILDNSLKLTLLQLNSLNFWQLTDSFWNFPLCSLGADPTPSCVVPYCCRRVYWSVAYQRLIPCPKGAGFERSDLYSSEFFFLVAGTQTKESDTAYIKSGRIVAQIWKCRHILVKHSIVSYDENSFICFRVVLNVYTDRF
jgi:hypothetical protein